MAGSQDILSSLSAALADGYRIEEEFAKGGMSRVFLAMDVRHSRRVAVKVLDPELAHSVGTARFDREIRLFGRLSHPNILPLLDSGDIDGLPYYITPFVEGESLRQRLGQETQLPFEDVIKITKEVAEALEYAHSQGVIHRDIKPENILLSSGQAVVADFGIAQALTIAGGEKLTRSGVMIGTPSYMSPEQASGRDVQLDGRSDLYSLACVTYEMLTGGPPFGGRTPQVVVARHLSARPSEISIVRPDVPAAVEEAVGRALAKVPADRFKSARDFADALVLGPPKARKAGIGRRTALLVPGVILLAVLSWMIWGWVFGVPLDPNRVVVFPLVSDQDEVRVGEGVASLLGWVLDDTAPLQWISGWSLLTTEQKDSPRTLSLRRAEALAREQGAGHFLTGRIVSAGDSVAVILELRAARDGSLMELNGASGPLGTPEATLALDAIPGLLLPLLSPGETVDPGLLAERAPSALVNFYQGESEYRRGRFEEALGHYSLALEQDSALAVASLRASETAIWLKRFPEGRAAAELTLQNTQHLPSPYLPLARGIHLLLDGRVDTALVEIREHLAQRPNSTAGGTILGEGLIHYFPDSPDPDAEAEAAFRDVLEADREFAPALYHLVELEVLAGDFRSAREAWTGMAEVELPEGLHSHISLLLACGEGVSSDPWRELADTVPPGALLGAGFILSTGDASKACAEDAMRRVVETDSLSAGYRFAALQGLGGVLVAQGRTSEAHRWTSQASWSGSAPYLHFLWDIASGETSPEAAERAGLMWDQGVERRPSSLLWLLGLWEATHGNPLLADSVSLLLSQRGDGARSLHAGVAAYAAAARGEEESSLQFLEGLRVQVPADRLQWDFWSGLYPERILLSDLLLRQGETDSAIDILRKISQPYPRTVVTAAFQQSIADLMRKANESPLESSGSKSEPIL